MTSTVRSFFIESIRKKLNRAYMYEYWAVFASVWKIIGEESFLRIANENYVEKIAKVLLSDEIIAKK